MSKEDISITQTLNYKREVGFGCSHCLHVQVVEVRHLPKEGETWQDLLAYLPEGWSLLRTAKYLDIATDSLICDRHQVVVARSRSANMKRAVTAVISAECATKEGAKELEGDLKTFLETFVDRTGHEVQALANDVRAVK